MLPTRPRDPFATSSARALWVEVADRRREWARQAGPGHFEGHPAYDRERWIGELQDALVVLEEAMSGARPIDPRRALLDLLAVGAALADVMGEPQPS